MNRKEYNTISAISVAWFVDDSCSSSHPKTEKVKRSSQSPDTVRIISQADLRHCQNPLMVFDFFRDGQKKKKTGQGRLEIEDDGQIK